MELSQEEIKAHLSAMSMEFDLKARATGLRYLGAAFVMAHIAPGQNLGAIKTGDTPAALLLDDEGKLLLQPVRDNSFLPPLGGFIAFYDINQQTVFDIIDADLTNGRYRYGKGGCAVHEQPQPVG